jgi:hypothetical protein
MRKSFLNCSTYLNHVFDSLDGLVTHLHDMMFDCHSSRDT